MKVGLVFFLCSYMSSLALGSLWEGGEDLFNVIYETDNRCEVTEGNHRKSWQQSSAIALVVKNEELVSRPAEGRVTILTQTLQESVGVCPEERFSQQQTAGFCTAFLIAPNLVLTAGHCLSDIKNCKDLSFVFGLRKEGVAEGFKTEVSQENIFTCKELKYHTTLADNLVDLALVELDRVVTERKSLVFSDSNFLGGDTKLYTIGHPLGLPMKLSKGGKVLDNSDPNYFASDLDSYSVSSGSPVLNERTGLVEGVLVRGQEDFIEKNGCYVSSVCDSPLCLGEEVLRTSTIKKVLADYLS